MARIFLSHSSRDNFEAVALRDWLASEGWDDVFLDLDPERGIAGGERWERALHQASARCEAVIFLVSSNWLASGWCLKEYTLARGLNKKLFAVFVDLTRTLADLPAELSDTWQVVDLVGGQDLRLVRTSIPGSHEEKHVGFSKSGLHRLKRGLEKAGLDPKFFAWPPEREPERAPYRGLQPLQALDAGIFFGRDAPIVEAVDRLRGLSAAAAPRLLVILGASGAGKSSFLRAGLLPRLARDDAQFLPLPAVRPERAALYGENGLLPALEAALPNRTRADLRAAIRGGAEALRPLLADMVAEQSGRLLSEEAGVKPPAIVLAIDQAEELFREEGETEASALLALVRDLTREDEPVVIVVFAIRSDSYDELEHAKALESMPQATLPLLPMPLGAYKDVIEGPARRATEAGYPLAIEPQLTERLLLDLATAVGSDALPLLAFTLEQLFLEYRRAGALRLADYRAFGGLEGAIDAAVERALSRADQDPRIPRERSAREALLRRGLIPWLAGIDPDSRAPRRNIARRSDIPAEAEPLVDLLIEERLLSTDTELVKNLETGVDARIATIEPTHEALLRQWGLLAGWLEEDFALLATLEGVKRGARDWNVNGGAPAWLAHQSERLAQAQELEARPDIAARLDAIDRNYLIACRSRENARRAEAEQRRVEREEEQARRLVDAERIAAAERRTTRRTRFALSVVSALAILAIVFAGLAIHQQAVADMARAQAQAALWLSQSEVDLQRGNVAAAIETARRAMKSVPSEATRTALLAALAEVSPHLLGTLEIATPGPAALAWVGQDTAGIASSDGTVRVVSSADASHPPRWSGEMPATVRAQRTAPVALQPLADGDLVALYADASVARVRTRTGSAQIADPGLAEQISPLAHSAAIGSDGAVLAFTSFDGAVISLHCDWQASDPRKICAEIGAAGALVPGGARSVAISPDETAVAAGDRGGIVHVCDIGFAACGRTSMPLGSEILSLAWSPDGRWIAAGTVAGDVVDLDAVSLREIARAHAGDAVAVLAWRPKAAQLLSACATRSVCLWQSPTDGTSGALPLVARFVGHHAQVDRLAWSPGGSLFGSIDTEGEFATWSLDQDRSVVSALPSCGSGALSMIAVSPDRSSIAAGGDAGNLCLWSIGTRELTIIPGTSPTTIEALAWSKRLDIAALHDDGALDDVPGATRRAALLTTLSNELFSRVVWDPDDRTIVATVSDGGVAFVDAANPGRTPVIRRYLKAADGASGMTIRPEDAALFVSYTASSIGIVDLRSKALRGTIASDPSYSGALSLSPDGRSLAATGSDGTVGLYDIESKRLLQKLPVDVKETRTVAFSPDGSKLAALSSANRTLYLWDMTNVKPMLYAKLDLARIGLFEPEAAGADWIAWTSPGMIAVAMSEGTVAIVDLDERKWEARIDALSP